jgi:hypothetical protein
MKPPLREGGLRRRSTRSDGTSATITEQLVAHPRKVRMVGPQRHVLSFGSIVHQLHPGRRVAFIVPDPERAGRYQQGRCA